MRRKIEQAVHLWQRGDAAAVEEALAWLQNAGVKISCSCVIQYDVSHAAP
jgi:hypothetical protein